MKYKVVVTSMLGTVIASHRNCDAKTVTELWLTYCHNYIVTVTAETGQTWASMRMDETAHYRCEG